MVMMMMKVMMKVVVVVVRWPVVVTRYRCEHLTHLRVRPPPTWTT